MPASITLSNLSWSTPDGRTLLSNLDLSFGAERTGLVGRNGVGKTTLLKLVAGELQPQSGSIAFGGRLGILRQAVQVEEGATVVDFFGASNALAILRRAEAGEATADEIAVADWTVEARIAAALERAGLDAQPETLLASLSGGQRTRAALAALVFSNPDFLILDEPTNNLDRDGREAVIALLAGWRAGTIVVSHDRELLETMDAIVEITTLGARRYGGNWSAFRERKALELAAAEHDLADAERRVADVVRSAQVTAERQARSDRNGRKKAARGDMPRIVAGGLKRAAENTSGNKVRLGERRREEAMEEASAARQRIEILQPFSAQLAPTGLPPGRDVLRLDGVTAGYGPGEPIIRNLSFAMTGPDRVAIAGPNGSGKTTLLALITGTLQPWSGTVAVMTGFSLFDQSVSLLDRSLSIRENFRNLNPDANENACHAALARFMFRADAALQQVSTLSGGQLLRAGLACVLGGAKPPLLILDEPTNHLDIDSLAAVEAGLQAYDGALLVVSHDEVFLENIDISRRLQLPLGEEVLL
ncbi:ABC-F family ATP-binding cassette domain-containing protein [Rhizobium sp. BK538]|uniref:ABC-F family ATP-binding cassette domain-containing protein n=1 Tax=Rhizobium sp. BK538 TaxID=2586984 RepID=UPI001612DBDF|nr:ABC-F family ATP-binding cassette domain-containing protein [Rhizobium sp. BK538]MBB4167084.1 ATPase subunit of ABC transporter with duplicated ATPase domains [Rhizobium sp. BK538]